MQMVLERFGLSFDCCLAREHAEPKPSPDAIFKIAGRLGLRAGDLLVVGDYIFDVQAGQNAGARTALLYTGRDYALEPPADFVLGGLLDVLNHVPVGPAVEAGG
jgi:phosphoglycolate phosphatase-like HAD superfamily hydrolase